MSLLYENQSYIRPFRLSEEFLKNYKTKRPDFGFNGLGELTYRRTYSRIKEDGGKEEWWETIQRVVEGTYNLQKRWIITNNLGWDNNKAQTSAKEMYDRMFHMKFLPAGRGLWAFGTALTEEKGLYLATNSCAMVTTEDIKERLAKPFCFLMDASMLGVGVGFDTKGAGKIRINQPKEDEEETYVISDDREGWVISLEKLLNSYFIPNQKTIVFDYSLIRDAGEPIKGFGGTASGYTPLENLHKSLFSVLGKRAGEDIASRDIVDIMNLIGKCVISGNVRRTAELALGEIDDEEFLNLKNYDKNPDRMEYGWTSNNSVFARIGIDYSEIADRIRNNGEPGLIWLENARAYSRIIDKPDYKDRKVAGMNPCCEQSLESYESCVSGDTRILTKDGYPRIKDVVGKTVSVWNGESWSKVTPRITGKNRDLLRIWFSDGSFLDCTPEHEFSIHTYRNKYRKTQAKDLKEGNELQEKNIKPKKDEGIKDENAYELGLFAGDGFIDSKYLRICAYDPEGKLDAIWDKGHLSALSNKIRYGMRTLTVTDLLDFKTAKHINDKTKGLPEYVFSLDYDSCLNFIAGWIDTDGCVSKNSNTYRYTVYGGEQKMRDLQLLCNKLGLKSVTIRVASKKGFKTNFGERSYSMWELSIPSNQCGVIPTRIKKIPENKIGKRTRVNNAHPESRISVIRRQKVSKIEKLDGKHTAYCFEEPIKHMGVFGNVLTYQCLLVETFPNRNESLDDFQRTLKFAYLYAKTVTLGKTHWQDTNRVLLRNRRIGLSMSGIAQFIADRGIDELKTWCEEGYRTVRHYDEIYSDWLAIPKSIKVTSVKPSGSVSLLAGATPGIHYPEGRHYIRRIRLSKTSDLIPAIKKAGYKIEPAFGQEDDTVVVEFPVSLGGKIRTIRDVSMWEQLSLGAFMQKYWSDNQVSQTVTFTKEEAKDIEPALELFQYQLKGVSFLPITEKGAYPQMPYESITEDQYNEMIKNIKPIDFSSNLEDAVDEKYCNNDVCII